MTDSAFSIGIEREGLRIDGSGRLAMTAHPAEFGDKLKSFRVSTDFGEAMMELRTEPRQDTASCYGELLQITKDVLKVLARRGELLWPYSMPCAFPDDSAFPFNSYPDDPDEEDYERELASVYGIRRLSISGIHFNFSVNDGMHARMREAYPAVPEDKDEAYMRCCRNLFQNERLIRHFLDASPTDLEGSPAREDSFRNSPEGYRCEKAQTLAFSSKRAYAESVLRLKRYERFGPVRVKSAGDGNLDAGILTRGIRRIELRLCDINPFDICGVSKHDLDFMTALMLLCMTEDVSPNTPMELLTACGRVNRTLSLGLEEGITAMIHQEECGQKRSDRVRDLIRRQGMDGFRMLAEAYGRTAAEEETT